MILGVDLFKVVDGDLGVDLGGFQRFMSKHLLDMPDGCAVTEHVGGAGMA